MAFMFESLEVYQKAVNFADQIVVLTNRYCVKWLDYVSGHFR